MNSLILLGLIFLTQGEGEPQTAEPLLMFALEGDTVTLPCGIPSIKSCSSVNWLKYGQYGTSEEVTNDPTHVLLWDCSLKITHLVLDDARLYSCVSGAHSSNLSLQILNVTESLGENDIELQCVLNTFRGYVPCKNSRIHMKWSNEDDTPIKGNRFKFKTSSDCFSTLIITKKPTDHHRKWKCHLTLNGEIKATISYTTTVRDGLEEVFASVGESVSLTCGHISSYGVEWAKVGGKPQTHDVTPDKTFHASKDSSLVISKLAAQHAGDYQCSESSGQKTVLNNVRLHTLDVTVESDPEGENLTLTCVLTCANDCDKDFNLSWSGSDQKALQSIIMKVNNTCIKTTFLPNGLKRRDEMTCSVHREGALMASKTWHTVNPLQTHAWLVLPLGLLICVAAGGVYMKRKHSKDAANKQSSIEMTHVYDVIQDVDKEEPLQQRQYNRETTNTTDSFYDLLQAVN